MKTLFCCILITGGLAGLVAALRPLPATPAAPPANPSAALLSLAPETRAARPLLAPVASAAVSRSSPVDELASALRRGGVADHDRAFNVLLPDLIARDPSVAGHFALAWEPGAMRDELLREVIRRWAATDIGGVITWTTSLLDETDRQTAAAAATEQVAQDDPAGAIELAQLLHTGVDDGRVEHLAQLWTEEHPREAVDWVVRRPADPLRDRLLARIAHVRAQQAPAEAAGLVMDHMTPGEARDDALVGVVRQWAWRDPAPVSAWVAGFPSGPLRTRALAAVAATTALR